ncbi:MAG: hypothetical protein QW279_14690 [Candidatus Jordarchaeaceae archaeon]
MKFLLNQILIDLSTAENVGQKRGRQDEDRLDGTRHDLNTVLFRR